MKTVSILLVNDTATEIHIHFWSDDVQINSDKKCFEAPVGCIFKFTVEAFKRWLLFPIVWRKKFEWKKIEQWFLFDEKMASMMKEKHKLASCFRPLLRNTKLAHFFLSFETLFYRMNFHDCALIELFKKTANLSSRNGLNSKKSINNFSFFLRKIFTHSYARN